MAQLNRPDTDMIGLRNAAQDRRFQRNVELMDDPNTPFQAYGNPAIEAMWGPLFEYQNQMAELNPRQNFRMNPITDKGTYIGHSAPIQGLASWNLNPNVPGGPSYQDVNTIKTIAKTKGHPQQQAALQALQGYRDPYSLG